MSQRELSSPGVSYAYISRIEAGARRPSVKALRLLARKLKVSPEYLERGSDLRETDERELELAEAELQVRLGEDGQGRAAEAALARVLEEALASGETAIACRARIGLGLAAARSGKDAEAVEQLEAALAVEPLQAAGRPDVYATLGRAYSNLGQPQRAVELFEGCLAEVRAQEPPDQASEIRYATYLSYALTDAGDSERAQRLLVDLAEDPLESADSYTRVRLFWSLGRVATREGRTLSGLSYFRRAVALLEATEDTLHLAQAHVSCAWALTKSGRAQEAGGHLEIAEQLFGPKPDPADLGWLQDRAGQAGGCPRPGRRGGSSSAGGAGSLGNERPRRARRRLLGSCRGIRPRGRHRLGRRHVPPCGRVCSPATGRAVTPRPPAAPGRSSCAGPAASKRRSTCSNEPSRSARSHRATRCQTARENRRTTRRQPPAVSQHECRGAELVICDICGETYDEKAYQIVVPVLRASFDKIECAERALERELRKAKRPARRGSALRRG